DGLPFLHKPPLWYWLSAASMSPFGVHAWAARLPSLAGALMTGASLFLFVRRWIDERTERTALVVLATMPLVYAGAQYANHDMLGLRASCRPPSKRRATARSSEPRPTRRSGCPIRRRRPGPCAWKTPSSTASFFVRRR